MSPRLPHKQAYAPVNDAVHNPSNGLCEECDDVEWLYHKGQADADWSQDFVVWLMGAREQPIECIAFANGVIQK